MEWTNERTKKNEMMNNEWCWLMCNGSIVQLKNIFRCKNLLRHWAYVDASANNQAPRTRRVFVARTSAHFYWGNGHTDVSSKMSFLETNDYYFILFFHRNLLKIGLAHCVFAMRFSFIFFRCTILWSTAFMQTSPSSSALHINAVSYYIYTCRRYVAVHRHFMGTIRLPDTGLPFFLFFLFLVLCSAITVDIPEPQRQRNNVEKNKYKIVAAITRCSQVQLLPPEVIIN